MLKKYVNGVAVELTSEEIEERNRDIAANAPTEEDKAKHKDEQKRLAYSKEADPLFFKWQRGEATKDEWLAKINEIKDRFK